MKCCDMTTGMLTKPVTIEKQDIAAGVGGASAITYSTRFSTRCKFTAASGSERMSAERRESLTQNRMTIRYNSALIESDRIFFRGKYYQITFIDNVENGDKWMVVSLSGGVAT